MMPGIRGAHLLKRPGQGGAMLAISAVQVGCAVSAAYLGARTAMAVGRDLRRDVFGTVQRLAEELGECEDFGELIDICECGGRAVQ